MKKVVLLAPVVAVALFFGFGSTRDAYAAVRGTWDFDTSGNIRSAQPFFEGDSAGSLSRGGMYKTLTPGTNYCTAGNPSGSFSPYTLTQFGTDTVGKNLFTDYGLGQTNCTDSGTYFFIFWENDASSTIEAWYPVYFNGAVTIQATTTDQTSGDIPTTQSAANVIIWSPEYGSTTATTTFNLVIQYKTPFSLDFRPTTTEAYTIYDAVSGAVEYTFSRIIGANTSIDEVRSDTVTTTPGSKIVRAAFYDQNGLPYSNLAETFFNVATNTYYAATGLLTPQDTAAGLTQNNCTLFDVGCQFQRALIFLFKPSDGTLDRFMSLWQQIAKKKPFGYIFVTIGQLETLSTTGSATFDLGTLPFMDAIFTPFKNYSASILWAVFALWWVSGRLVKLEL